VFPILGEASASSPSKNLDVLVCLAVVGGWVHVSVRLVAMGWVGLAAEKVIRVHLCCIQNAYLIIMFNAVYCAIPL